MTETPKTGKYKLWEPTLLALCTILGLYAGSQLNTSSSGEGPRIQAAKSTNGRELNEIVRFIEEKYVDEVNSEALISGAVEALLKDLDPHSGYLTPDEISELNEKMEGHFTGIGIEFQRVLDTAIVLYVQPGGPADKAGLRMFDRIVRTNDSSMVDPKLTEKDMVSLLRKSEDPAVRLRVARPGIDSLISITITRAEIPLKSVDGAYMIKPDVGYIRINRFSAKTYKEFMDHLEHLVQKEGMRDLIIDVRQNPGGFLKEAVNILSQLFDEKGRLLVYTEGEHAARTEYHTTGKPFYPVSNIAVLTDDGSASASEIIAGAIQDHDRGIIVGTPTYGKGLVQEQYPLSNGGALRLTVARYYTPSGRLIQKPYLNGESVTTTGNTESDTTQYHTTAGREVNGSGGITPDILVSQDFSWNDKRFGQMYADVLEYAIHGYHADAKYSSVEDLLARFPSGNEVAQNLLDYYNAHARKDRIADTAFIIAHSEYARTMLMSMIGSVQLGHQTWMRVMNANDPVVQKALEVIKDDRKTTLKY